MASKTINITISNTKTIPFVFPDLDTLPNNNALKHIEFYASTSNNISNIVKIGMLKDLSETTNIDINDNSSACYFVFKYVDSRCNNENYNDLVYWDTGTKNYYWKFQNSGELQGYFQIYTSNFTNIGSTSIKNIMGLTANFPEPEPEPEPEPTEKEITIEFFSGFAYPIKSNIEFFYSVADTPNQITNEIVSIGRLSELTSDTIKLKYLSNKLGVYILYRYVTDNAEVNSNVCDEFLKTTSDSLGYFENGYFIFKKNNALTYFSSNDTIKEYTYATPIINIENKNITYTPKQLTITDYPETITITANSDYFFSDIPYLILQLPNGMGTKRVYFTLNEDNTIATLIFTLDYSTAYITSFNVLTERKTEISDKYGLITLYKPNSEQLKQLSRKLLYKYSLDNQTLTLLDLSKYIISFLSMPFDINVFGTKEMTLNSISTGLEMGFINDNILELNFGGIEITGFYNNSIDYRNTKLSLYLPFVGSIDIDTTKYMNKTINLIYRVDLFTGEFVAILTNDNIILDSFSGNCAINIPFVYQISKTDISVKGYSSNNNNLLNDLTPKLIVTSNIKNENVKISTNYYTQLNRLSGFNIIDEFEEDSTTHLNKDDLENIINLLSKGVIF